MSQLYLDLKGALRKAAKLPPPGTDLKECLWQAWQAYLHWTLDHPNEHQVVAKLATSMHITEETRMKARQDFADVAELLGRAMARGALRNQPADFVGALMGAMADTTRDFMAQNPASSTTICEDGFKAFWNAISKS